LMPEAVCFGKNQYSRVIYFKFERKAGNYQYKEKDLFKKLICIHGSIVFIIFMKKKRN
jgi:hypothetical protein